MIRNMPDSLVKELSLAIKRYLHIAFGKDEKKDKEMYDWYGLTADSLPAAFVQLLTMWYRMMTIECTENPQDNAFRLRCSIPWFDEENEIETIVLNGQLVYLGSVQDLPMTQINDYRMHKDNYVKAEI